MGNKHLFYRKSSGVYEFTENVLEITILDRRGQVVWQHKRAHESGPIRWPGMDLYGAQVSVGSYTCKVVYAQNAPAVYMPFVFAQD